MAGGKKGTTVVKLLPLSRFGTDLYNLYKINFQGTPVVLEANGDVPEIVREREEDVRTIYTATDVNEEKIIEKYDISYIYIGKCEYGLFKELR